VIGLLLGKNGNRTSKKQFWINSLGILALKNDERVETVYFTRDALIVDLMDGRIISVPLTWYPRLLKATQKQKRFDHKSKVG
jgi:hypothetical protein